MKKHNDPELTCVRSNPQVSRLSVMPFRLKWYSANYDIAV